MVVKVTLPDGTVVDLGSVQDAADLLQTLKPSSPARQHEKPTEKPAPAVGLQFLFPQTHSVGPVDKTPAMLVLSYLGARGGREVPSDEFGKLLGVTSHKGLGGRIAGINREIQRAGFDPESVWISRKTSNGRVFKAGPMLDACLIKLVEG